MSANLLERQLIELRQAITEHMKTFIENLAEGDSDDDTIKFCEFMESRLSGENFGEWHYGQPIINGVPMPYYGAVFVFEYEGDICIYGWNSGKYEIGFYSLPYCGDKPMPLEADNYVYIHELS